MPSGKTHDLITFLLVPPTLLLSFWLSQSWPLSAIVVVKMIFGGLMFGPDLDINSRQYQRWGPLRIIWWPYKSLFSHRSPFTHGIFLGTIVRIIYFFIVVALILAISLYLRALWQGSAPQGEELLFVAAHRVSYLLKSIDHKYLIAGLIGLWWGAASHTISDLVVTTLKQIIKSL